MIISELYDKIKNAYSNENLNRISVTLINLYREQQTDTLRQIAEMISDSVDIPVDADGKFFSKLMMLYHPDRGDYHRKEIDRLAANNDQDGLLGYAHILLLNRIEEIAATLTSYEDIDYSPVYEWDINTEDFTIINTHDEIGNFSYGRKSKKPGAGYTFFEGMKMRIYGRISMNLPTGYLEDIDEFELSQSEIIDLDGIQYCRHAVVMDLSDNRICDISLLQNLTMLQELNLSDNDIEDVDVLANLRDLRSLNLSNNAVKDISFLMELPRLEYIDLTGNKVPSSQIRNLEESGINVIC